MNNSKMQNQVVTEALRGIASVAKSAGFDVTASPIHVGGNTSINGTRGAAGQLSAFSANVRVVGEEAQVTGMFRMPHATVPFKTTEELVRFLQA